MYYLEKEFKRIKKYAEGLGIDVTLLNSQDNSASAMWTTDGKEIIIFNYKREGWLSLCLSFIHELAHHMAWVYNGRKVDLKTDQALYSEESRKLGEVIPKAQRKLIYESEKNDAEYQVVIWNELKLNIPKWRLILEKELDVWIYYRYYIDGVFPSKLEVKEKRKTLKEKLKC